MRATQPHPLQKSCLVIDNSAHIRHLICTNLTVRGFDVQESPTLGNGIRMMADWHPAVIILEMPFTQLEAHDWLFSLQDFPEMRGISLIVFTTESYTLKALRAINPNVAAVLEKPITIGVLMSTLSTVLYSYSDIGSDASDA
jgi:DNA-binding response OmpR family regulator